jgi:hypothetical protein
MGLWADMLCTRPSLPALLPSKVTEFSLALYLSALLQVVCIPASPLQAIFTTWLGLPHFSYTLTAWPIPAGTFAAADFGVQDGWWWY